MSLLLLFGGAAPPVEQTGSFSLDAIVQKAQAGSVSLDAVLKKEIAGSGTLDSVVFKTQTASFTLDAVIQKTLSGSFTLDGIVLKPQADSLTLDAFILAVQQASLSLDAVVFKTLAGSFTLDSVLFKEQSVAGDVDAIVLREQAGSGTTDAVIQKEITGSGALDAVLFKTMAASYALDAYITDVTATVVTETFGMAAEIVGPPGAHDRRTAHFGTQPDTTITMREALGPLPVGATLDQVLAYLYGGSASLDQFPFFGVAAFIQPYVNLNAVLLKTQTPSFGVDAWLARGASFGLNSIVKMTWGGSLGVSAYIAAGAEPWNVVRTPISGTATYTAQSFSGSETPDRAANGVTYYDFVGDGWEKASGAYVAGLWWQVSWSVTQSVNKVILYSARQSGGSPLANGRFGTTGHLEFSDGSTEPWVGWTDHQQPLEMTFSTRHTP